MKSRDENATPHMDTMQLHFVTASDVAEYMQEMSKFSKLRMKLISQKGLARDKILQDGSPDTDYTHWEEDQHTLDVMVLDLENVIQHIIHVSNSSENKRKR